MTGGRNVQFLFPLYPLGTVWDFIEHAMGGGSEKVSRFDTYNSPLVISCFDIHEFYKEMYINGSLVVSYTYKYINCSQKVGLLMSVELWASVEIWRWH
jgi:hypothetical protein